MRTLRPYTDKTIPETFNFSSHIKLHILTHSLPKVLNQSEAKRDGVINPQNYKMTQF